MYKKGATGNKPDGWGGCSGANEFLPPDERPPLFGVGVVVLISAETRYLLTASAAAATGEAHRLLSVVLPLLLLLLLLLLVLKQMSDDVTADVGIRDAAFIRADAAAARSCSDKALSLSCCFLRELDDEAAPVDAAVDDDFLIARLLLLTRFIPSSCSSRLLVPLVVVVVL